MSYKTLDHSLQISKFRTCLTLALNSAGLKPVAFWKRDGELKFSMGFAAKTPYQAGLFRVQEGKRVTHTVRPDGFFEVAGNYFALEIDRGTMGLRGVGKKLLGYLKFLKLLKAQPKKIDDHIVKDFRVITVTTNPLRLKHLQETARKIDDRPGQGWRGLLFCLGTDWNLEDPRSILRPIFKTPILRDQPTNIG